MEEVKKNVLQQLESGELSQEPCYGFFDWFCIDKGLPGRSARLVGKLKSILKDQNRFDPTRVHVCFKNNCPLYGKLYDDFRICELVSGNVLYTVSPSLGYTSDHGRSSIWARVDINNPVSEMVEIENIKTWEDVLVWFGKTPKAKSAFTPLKAVELVEKTMTVVGCRYPRIHVRLAGGDGNAFAILGTVRRALFQGGVATDQVNEFMDDATSGDYDHLLQTCMKWVDVS